MLVQPQRGGTTNLFMQRVAEATAVETSETPTETSARVTGGGGEGEGMGTLEARLLDRYDDKIWKMHLDYLQRCGSDGGGDSYGRDGDDNASLQSSSSATASAPPAYLPDEHQPLLVEVVRKLVGGSGTERAVGMAGARTVASAEPESADGEQSWVSWSGCLFSREALANSSETATNTCTGGGSDGVSRGCVQKESPVPPLPQPVELDPSLLSSPPRATAAEEQQQRQRPDRRMTDEYDSLAERIRVNIREGRRKAATEAGLVGDAVVRTGGEDDWGAAVGGRQQLWVAIAGAPGSGKTTLAVRTLLISRSIYDPLQPCMLPPTSKRIVHIGTLLLC